MYIRASLVSSVGKESAYNAGDLGSIPGLGRYPGEGNGNPLQYSCLENLMDRGAWQTTVHGVARVGHDLETKPTNQGSMAGTHAVHLVDNPHSFFLMEPQFCSDNNISGQRG